MSSKFGYPGNKNRNWKVSGFSNPKENNIRNKYGNEIKKIDGIKFDSKKEASAYFALNQMLKAKLIKSIDMQVKYELQEHFRNALGNMIRAITYKADFVVIDNDNKEYVIDIKGYPDQKFPIKRKMFEYKFKKVLYVIKTINELHNLIIGGVYNGK